MQSILPISENSPFTIENIPFGIFSPTKKDSPRVGVALGDYVFDLAVAADHGVFQSMSMLSSKAKEVFHQPSLNAFMALGYDVWSTTRRHLQKVFSTSPPLFPFLTELQPPFFYLQSSVSMHLPCEVGDYTDFYASKEHATNVGTLFRGAENALMPNWLHLPIGYHGRASSIQVSSSSTSTSTSTSSLVHRPWGQSMHAHFGPSKKLDFELEMAFLIGTGNPIAKPIPLNETKKRIFGAVIMNDWSARDIQAWEYQPLGPFLGKSFATTISPWVVTMDALEPFLVQGPEQVPPPLPYLRHSQDEKTTYDIQLTVEMKPKESKEFKVISQSNLKWMYWSVFQQCAHHTINGCNLRTGDLLGTGTLSGSTPDSLGSLLELTWNGQKKLTFDQESGGPIERTFLQDGDQVKMTAWCMNKDGLKLGFGECLGEILPALPLPFDEV